MKPVKFIIQIAIMIVMLSVGFWLSENKYSNLKKYLMLDSIIKDVSQNTYDYDKFDCVNFSKEAQEKLNKAGIKSTIMVVKNPDEKNYHAIVAVWIEPQTNEFASSKYNQVKIYDK